MDLDSPRFQSTDDFVGGKQCLKDRKVHLATPKQIVTPAAQLGEAAGKQGFTVVQNGENLAQTETSGVF